MRRVGLGTDTGDAFRPGGFEVRVRMCRLRAAHPTARSGADIYTRIEERPMSSETSDAPGGRRSSTGGGGQRNRRFILRRCRELARPLQQTFDLMNVTAWHAQSFVMPAHSVCIRSVEQAVHLAG